MSSSKTTAPMKQISEDEPEPFKGKCTYLSGHFHSFSVDFDINSHETLNREL